jgi:hypothetical protein
MMTLIVCALTASGAIFIIVTICSPFNDILEISPVAVRDGLNQLGKE